MLLLPYYGDKGTRLTKSLKINLYKHLPNNGRTQIKFTCQKLGSQFKVKDGTKFDCKYDVLYIGICKEQN